MAKRTKARSSETPTRKRERLDQVKTFLGIFARSTLFLIGMVSIITAIVFIFVPVDGPFGEIAFGSIGITLLFLALTGKPPGVAESEKALKAVGGR